MTISSQTRKAGPFIGNGSTTAFPFSFKVFAASDLQVVRANSAGVETILTLNSDYTVTLNANQTSNPGGTVTLASALAVGSTMAMTSVIGYLQPTDLTNQGGFYPTVINTSLDRLTMLTQQLKEQVDRSAKLPITNDGDAESLVADIVRLADSADNIDTVAGSIGDVNTVADDIADVSAVAGSIANVNATGGAISNVNTVATNISAVNNVSTNMAAVTAAVNSASNAATSATNAASSATAAASSASGASSSASTATTKASEASTSATNASSSASSASSSATSASGSASTATIKASEASTSASNASTSATAAASSATAAASSATSAASAKTAAESARDSTLAAFDSFDDRYLGAKSSDPTVDNDGNPLVAGALYFNSGAGAMKVYTGSAWVAAYVSGTDFLPLSGGEMSGPITSDGINYTPAGTGAVQRTMESKLGETVSVTDYGAVGNGTTEDTTAVQAAINSGAKRIVFPPGKTFLIDQVTSAGTDTTFYCVGSTIKLKPSSTYYRTLTFNHARCTVIGGTWDGNRANQSAGDQFSSWAIALQADDCVARDATIKEFRGSGVKIYNANRCLVENCKITNIGYSTSSPCYGIYGDTVSGTALYGNKAIGNFIQIGQNGLADQGILFNSNSTTGGEAQWDWEIIGNTVYGSTNASAGDLSINLAVRGHRGKVIGNTTTAGAMGWSEGGDYTIIENNTFIDTVGTIRWGVEASGKKMIVANNVLTGHLRGICFSFDNNDDMVIAGNTIETDGTGNHCIAVEIPVSGTGKNITIAGNMMKGRRAIIATRETKGINIVGNTFVGPGSGTSGSRFVFFDTPTTTTMFANIKANKISACERAVSVYSASATTYTDIAFTGNNCRDDVAGGVFSHVIAEGSAVMGSRIKNFDNEQNSTSDNFSMLFDNTNKRGIEYSNSYSTPEGNVTAGVGSIYVSLASGVRVLWMKSSGTGNTGWAQMLGAASAGTTGQILTSQGSSSLPVFADPAGGGSMRLISQVVASGASEVEFLSGINSTYDTYMFEISGLYRVSGGTAQLLAQLYSGGAYVAGSSYLTHITITDLGSTAYAGQSHANQANAKLTNTASIPNSSNANAYNGWATLTGVNVGRANLRTRALSNGDNTMIDSNTNIYANAITGIKFLLSAGTMNCTIRMYGIAKS